MLLSLRLVELELRTAIDDLSLIFGIVRDDLEQAHLTRLAACDRDHIDREHVLKPGRLEQRGERLFAVHALAQFDDGTLTVAVGLVHDVGYAAENFLFLFAQFVDLLKKLRLVLLIRKLGDDDHLLVAVLFDIRARPDDDPALAGSICLLDALAVNDHAARRKVGRGDVLHHLFQSDTAVLDVCDDAVDDFAEVVRRDVCSKTDRDAHRAVDEQVGELARQHIRLLQRVVEVERKADRLLVYVAEHLHRERSQSRLCITHRRGAVAVDAAEVAVSVDEKHARIERLRKPDHRVIDAAVAVRMIFAEALADDPCRLLVRLVGSVAELAHRKEDAALDGFETVFDARQRSVKDDMLGIGHHRSVHYVFDAVLDDDRLVFEFFFFLCHVSPSAP